MWRARRRSPCRSSTPTRGHRRTRRRLRQQWWACRCRSIATGRARRRQGWRRPRVHRRAPPSGHRRAERLLAGASQHADQGGVVAAEAVPGVDKLAMCLRPNGVHALRTVDRDDRDRSALLVEKVLVVAHRVYASRSSRLAWKRPIALSCLPNSTKVLAPACRPRCTPSDISLSSTPPSLSRFRAPAAASALADTRLATSGVTMAYMVTVVWSTSIGSIVITSTWLGNVAT